MLQSDIEMQILKSQMAMKSYISSLTNDWEELLHWRNVADSFDVFGKNADEEIFPVALFHDLVEDGYATLDELQKRFGLSDKQIGALNILTRKKRYSYSDYIKYIRVNEIARKVKIADLHDNIIRCVQDLPKRWSLLVRYAKAYGVLCENGGAE